MIREFMISNFHSLGPDIYIRPEALSILIGPNGSGKSNILDALSFVRDAVMQGLPAAITHRGGIDNVRRHSHGRPFDVHVKLEICGTILKPPGLHIHDSLHRRHPCPADGGRVPRT